MSTLLKGRLTALTDSSALVQASEARFCLVEAEVLASLDNPVKGEKVTVMATRTPGAEWDYKALQIARPATPRTGRPKASATVPAAPSEPSGPLFRFDPSTLHSGQPYAHQTQAVEWLRDRPRALLSDDVGLGKTVTVAAYLADVVQEFALYCAPKHLLEQVAGELTRLLPGTPVTLFADYKLGDMPRGVMLANYELLASRTHLLEALEPTLVVLDEIQSLRGGGEQHKAVLTLTGRPNLRVLGMSASPMETSLRDLHRVLEAIGIPGLPSLETWNERYVEFWPPNDFGVSEPKGIKPEHLHEVHSLLDQFNLGRSAAQAGLHLPEVERMCTRSR